MDCKTHAGHEHNHGASCGHTEIQHDGHTDYVHDGHLHHMHGDHIDEHKLTDSGSTCTPDHACGSHDSSHKHGTGCGHDAVPHGDHVDYLVAGHLHHPCSTHCDEHGKISVA